MFKQGIGFHYNVSNFKNTIDFYAEKLGFKLIYCDTSRGQAMVTTNTNDCFIGFAEAQSIAPSSTCITFEVENINYAVQSLQQKGIKFEGEIIEVPCTVKLATFTDPDGYKLMLSERIINEK